MHYNVFEIICLGASLAMGDGIAIIGLNGSGKSTLGHYLANKLGYYEIDVEDYYFPEQKKSRQNALEERYGENYEYLGEIPYSIARSKKEVEQSIEEDIKSHSKFVICGVTMNWNDSIMSSIKVAFWLKAPTNERVKRVKEREEKRWGERVIEGGDMYEQQLSFRDIISKRDETKVEDSIKNLKCVVIELDGMAPIENNVEIILNYLSNEM